MDEIHVCSGHIYRNFQDIIDLDGGKSIGYIQFDQIAGNTSVRTIINKNTILKMVLY